jgi:uncharacterized phage infection (PIP) family protein YhgE
MSVSYQNDPSLPDYCPDPSLVIDASLKEMGEIVKDQVCKVAQEGKLYTDQEAVKLQQQIDALTGSADNSQKIQELVDLINTLDIDEDGSILNDLLAIKAIAEAAKQDAADAKSESAATKAAFDAYRDSNNATVTALQASVNSLSAVTGQHTQSISSLQQDFADLKALVESLPTTVGLTISEVAKMISDAICAQNKKVVAAFESGMAAFRSTMEGPCPVEGEDPVGGGAVI